jgi:competence ComEA-like helix-hairpin-helix protein
MRLIMLMVSLLAGSAAGQALREFKECRLSPTEWADGDSFEVVFPDGKKRTIRLYGVDCMEMHVNGDDSNARRLRDQRRHFGIADILTAKAAGEAAKRETAALLAKPFTVHTAFADGRGDGRFERILAFVRTGDGADLAETLVSKGLARAFGITRQRPDGTSGDDWQEHLGDLELTAARAGAGAWRHTDWTRLPALREEARRESAEIEQAKGVRKAAENHPVDLNTAPRDELMTLPNVAEKTANAIIQARPFQRIEDLDKVPGIGPATIERLRPFLTIKSPP